MEIEETTDENIENTTKYFEQFFGERKEYYFPKLIALDIGKKFSFNIGSFFFGIFWFLYHRLYLHSLIILLIAMVESKVRKMLLIKFGDTQDMEMMFRMIWISAFAVTLGYCGNYFLLKHSKKKVANIISSTDDEALRMKKLKKSGSGNWILILSIIILLVLAIIWGQA